MLDTVASDPHYGNPLTAGLLWAWPPHITIKEARDGGGRGIAHESQHIYPVSLLCPVSLIMAGPKGGGDSCSVSSLQGLPV